MTKALEVKCPTCGKKQKWTTENKNRPFCSERCKLIDLGDWAGENHKISGDPIENDVFSEDLDGGMKH